jgi:excinuclease ABC subunit C
VKHLRERQLVDRPGSGDLDVFGIAQDGDLATVLILPLRGGRLGDRFTFVVENAASSSPDELVLLAAEERYGGPNGTVPPLVCVPAELDEGELIGELLSEWRGGRVELRVPERGANRKLLELAQTNAAHALEEARLQGERTRLRRFGALEELREVLNLESLPLRIECFDISNLGEQATMASMVVFEQGVPKKADYRIFGIGHDQGQDDFASMSEAVRRRFTRLANADSADDGYDPGFASVPNLVVIDGGKGQLSAALGALDGLDLPRVAAIGLAKRIEEVYVPGRSDPILLPPDSPALLLLRRIRDEAHRFALKHHRRRRAKASGTNSLFERLPGVGPARKQALLQHFGSPAGVLAATADELESVPGLPRKTAREIHAFLNKTGGAAST